jgi:hypothetical protein
MFCGGSGHTVEDCKKCPQEAQVKAASTESSTGQVSTSQGDKSSESKNRQQLRILYSQSKLH